MITTDEKVKGMSALHEKKRNIEESKRSEEDRASRASQSAGNELRIGKNTISLQSVETVSELVAGHDSVEYSPLGGIGQSL
eukprot:1561927-Amphidinium_carterae.1